MTTTKSNIKKVQCYGANFGEKMMERFFSNIKPQPWNWKTDLGKYERLHTLYKTDLKDNKKEEVHCKVLKLRNLYGLQLCIHNDELPRVVQHLFKHKKDISKDIKRGDKNIVGDLAKNAAYPKRLWTFATKFCFFVEKNNEYPIDDSLVRGALKHYEEELKKLGPRIVKIYHGPFEQRLKDVKKIWRNPDPNTSDPLDYSVYKDTIDDFIKIYHLDGITYRELDWYLWVFGKILKKKNDPTDKIHNHFSKKELEKLIKDMALEVKYPLQKIGLSIKSTSKT